MRLIFVVVTLAVSACAVSVVPSRGYHEEVGIPLLAKIKAREEKLQSGAVKQERIVGGVIAEANAHPFFGGLLIDLFTSFSQSVCGSTVLTASRLVTSAHCWFDGWNLAWRLTVVLGSSRLMVGGSRIQTTDVVMHPLFTPERLLNDVAIIYLPFNVQFSNIIQPISLPASTTTSFYGYWATTVGFGQTSDFDPSATSLLKEVRLQVISTAQCLSVYGPEFVFPSTLCTSGAGGVGVCGGDSGGPLFYTTPYGEPVLIGVSSFAADGMCQAGFPSGFARVTSFINFINQHLP